MFTIYAYTPNIDPEGKTGAIRFFGAYEDKVTNVFDFMIVDVQFYIDEEPALIPGFNSCKVTKARCKSRPIPSYFNVNYITTSKKYVIKLPEEVIGTYDEWVEIPFSEVSFAESLIHGIRNGNCNFEFFLCVGDSQTSVRFLDKRGAICDTKYTVSHTTDPSFAKFMIFNEVGQLSMSVLDANVYRFGKNLGNALTLRDNAEAYYKQTVFLVMQDNNQCILHIYR